MPQENNGKSGKGPGQEKSSKFFDARLRLIFWGAVAVFVFFVCLYFFDRNPSKGLQLLTANALSLLVLVVIAVQAHIYNRQRKHMEEHLDAMREQLNIMTRQQNSAEQQLILSGVQADAMLSQWVIMRESLIETQKLVEQTERAVAAAQHSTKIARQTAIYTLRAYVDIPGGHVHCSAEKARFVLSVQNLGKTPAQNVRISVAVEIGKPHLKDTHPVIDEHDEHDALLTWEQIGIIGPSYPVDHFTDLEMTAEQARSLESGECKLYCRGIIRYKDHFRRKRFTKFCFVHHRVASGLTFGPCSAGGNEAN
jgi:hypothetical protein